MLRQGSQKMQVFTSRVTHQEHDVNQNSDYEAKTDYYRKVPCQLTGLNFNSNLSSCVYKLLIFINVAVCQHQRKSIRTKVAGLRQQQVARTNDKDCVKNLSQFLLYRLVELANLRVNEFVMQQVIESFTVHNNPAKELSECYVYVYWSEAAFGVRKISVIARRDDKRTVNTPLWNSIALLAKCDM